MRAELTKKSVSHPLSLLRYEALYSTAVLDLNAPW